MAQKEIVRQGNQIVQQTVRPVQGSPFTQSNRATAVQLRISGISTTAPLVYDPTLPIVFTNIQYKSRNIEVKDLTNIVLPRGTYDTTFILNGQATGVEGIFLLLENGVEQGRFAVGAGDSTARLIIDVEKDKSILQLRPFQVTTLTLTETQIDLLSLSFVKIGDIPQNLHSS
jgi:hypothetical protein